MLMRLSKSVVNSINVHSITLDILESIDRTGGFRQHSELVAYIMYKVMKGINRYTERDMRIACAATLLHDIGLVIQYGSEFNFYSLNEDESNEHSVYGYIMFKYIANLGSISTGILLHHTDYSDLSGIAVDSIRFANMLHLIDYFTNSNFDIEAIENNRNKFNSESIYILRRTIEETDMMYKIQSGLYRDELRSLMEQANYSSIQIKQALRTLIYSMEWRKPGISLASSYNAYLNWVFGHIMGLSEGEKSSLYIAGAISRLFSGNKTIGNVDIENIIKLSYSDLDDSNDDIVRVAIMGRMISDELIKYSNITPTILESTFNRLVPSQRVPKKYIDLIYETIEPLKDNLDKTLGIIKYTYKDKSPIQILVDGDKDNYGWRPSV